MGEGKGRDHGSRDRATPERGRGASRTPPGAGCGHSSPRRRPWTPPREPPGARRGGSPAQGVTGARGPPGPLPLPAGGPRGPVPAGAAEGVRKRGRWRANPEPPGPQPASRPRPRPQRASGTHARTQKVKSGASPARRRHRRRRPTPAPRPHRGPACAARALPPRSHPSPRPPRRPSPRRRPCRPRHLHTPPALPRSCLPSAGSHPCSSGRTPPGKKAPAATAPAGPGFPRLPGLRRAASRGPEQGPAAQPPLPSLVLTSRPAPRAAASTRLALQGSSPELSRPAPERLLSLPGTRRLPALPPPPGSRVPGSAAPRGWASRAPHAWAAVPAHNNSLPGRPARGSAGLRAPRAAARVGMRRPPPAAREPPGEARLPMWPSRRQVRAAVGADLRRRRGSPGCGRHVPVLITAAWLFISMEILPQLPPPPPPPPPRLCTCGERHRPRELASRGGGSGTGLARPPPPRRLRANAVTAQGTGRKLASGAPERGPGNTGATPPAGSSASPWLARLQSSGSWTRWVAVV